MFLTVHSATGIIIGQTTGNIWLAFLAGFASHFLFDIIPHGDQNLGGKKENSADKNKKTLLMVGITDAIVMLVLCGVLILTNQITLSPTILVAVIGAILPDFINALYIFFKMPWLKNYNTLHTDLHYAWFGITVNFKLGFIVQLIFLITFITMLL